ncbi:PDZ domain-containing protein, partial [Paenibacillus sepulcri]|nr:PDZ domain-containing protein [Paenibacillus sepulcri]
IAQVMPESPAEGQLKPGDQLLAIDGHPVRSAAELTARMGEVNPGAEVAVKLKRDGNTTDAAVKTMASADDPKRAVFGIQVEDRVQADLPKKVDFRSYLVYQGGPS